MPKYMAMTLDRLIEPKATGKVKQPPNSKLERRNTSPSANIYWPRVSPELYATPEATPLPDSPLSSFPPSPYIVNYKRRGPRPKSLSPENVSLVGRATEEEHKVDQIDESGRIADREVVDTIENVYVASAATTVASLSQENVSLVGRATEEKNKVDQMDESGRIADREVVDTIEVVSVAPAATTVSSPCEMVGETGLHDGKIESKNLDDGLGGIDNLPKPVAVNVEREGEYEDFFDLQESMSFNSNTEMEDSSGVERSLKPFTPLAMGEYFDAWEELSTEGGRQSSLRDIETELREIRLSLLIEIERRKQAEEALNNMQTQWQRIGQQLSLLGLTLPADPTVVAQDGNLDLDPAEELCQQVYLARAVSYSVGRGSAKAELEMEMESRITSKNCEIARLLDRLHYYEAVNHEMSQRNQEAVEMARRHRQRRKERRRWVWSFVGTAITLGTAALAWSYLPTSRGPFPTSHHLEHNDAAKP